MKIENEIKKLECAAKKKKCDAKKGKCDAKSCEKEKPELSKFPARQSTKKTIIFLNIFLIEFINNLEWTKIL